MQPDLAPVDVERRYQATFVGLLVLAFALAGGWWLLADGDAAKQGASPAAVEATAIPGPTSFAEVETRPEPAAVALAGGDDEIQLCGGHWVKAGPDGKPAEEALRAFTAKAYDEVSRGALSLMAASSSPRVQAAAHYYLAGQKRLEQEGRKAELDTHREALARMALVTDDAQVYAWAYQACRTDVTAVAGTCMQINAAQWARMDPDNAEPWLAVADEARRRRDDAALDDAMYHVAAAERHQSGWVVVAAIVADHAPQDERSIIGSEIAVGQAIGTESHLASWQGVFEYCGVKATADPNRRETCERVAALLVERSNTLVARSMGVGIGRRLGWSGERLNALADQRDAESMAERLRAGDPPQDDLMSCTAMRAHIERIRAVAEFGEIETLRRDVEASGQSVATLAAQSRRLQEADVRRFAAEEAASAASAPLPAASATAVAQR